MLFYVTLPSVVSVLLKNKCFHIQYAAHTCKRQHCLGGFLKETSDLTLQRSSRILCSGILCITG